MMAKRAQGRKRFGRRNFKQRYFKLTTYSLSYAKSKAKRSICDIPLSDILGVERLNEQSFKMQNIFQIIRKDRPLYVQTSNCVEEKEWVDLLSKICQSNSERLKMYHEGAFVGGKYTCCSRTDENIEGCTRIPNKPFQMELATALDPARDLQRLHTLVMSNITHLQSLLDPSSNHQQPSISDESLICKKTVHKLIEIAYNLEQIHRKYKQALVRELRYGSRQAPIGDDNYLHMIRGNLSATLAQSSQQHSSSQQHTFECSTVCYPRQDILRNSNSDKITNNF